MKRAFNLMLGDDDRAALEAYRVAHGLRSHAEVIRHMIDAKASDLGWTKEAPPASSVKPEPKDAGVLPPLRPKATEPKPFQTRLKGQWKAP